MEISPQAKRASLAIINSTVNPALRHESTNVTASLLAEVIERETSIAALLEAAKNIESHLSAWANAIAHSLEIANTTDDRAFWQHELNALLRDGPALRAAITKTEGSAESEAA